jgi:hypothetical protein
VNDEEGIADLDLTSEVPTSRATVRFEIKMPNILGGSTIKVFAGGGIGPTLLQMGLVGLGIAAVAWGIGIPALTALIVGLCAPAIYAILVRIISGSGTK